MPDRLVTDMIRAMEAFQMPPMVLLDVTNVCNLHCGHCPHTEIAESDQYRPQHMSWSHFSKIVHELSQCDGPCLLHLVGDGEPMLHPRIVDMVELAKRDTKCVVNLTTNGTLLSQKNIDRLYRCGIDIIEVSLDALFKGTYEQIRKGASYERVMRNVFYLLDARRSAKAPTRLLVSFVDQAGNHEEARQFQQFWEPLVDRVMIRKLHSASGRIKQDEVRARIEADRQDRYPCPHLWKRLIVDVAGNIKYCATDWGTASALGTIEDSSLMSVWQGKELRDLRDQHVHGDYTACEKCSECSDWASSRWDWGYERIVDLLIMKRPTLAPCLPLLG